MTTVTMLAPAPFFVVGAGSPSDNTYTADYTGVINGVAANDVLPLMNAGCQMLTAVKWAGRLLGANFNVTTDQAIPLIIPASATFRVTKITVKNASLSLTTAAGGVYPAASKGGTALVAAGQVYTALTGATIALDLTLATANAVQAAGTLLYLALTTPQGAAATGDVYVFADVYQ